jgi:hypothetical protein
VTEPTALDALAYIGLKIAEYGAYTIIAVAILGFGIATGWLG